VQTDAATRRPDISTRQAWLAQVDGKIWLLKKGILMSQTQSMKQNIAELLGDEAESLLGHQCRGISKQALHLPGPDVVDRIYSISDRKPRVLVNLQRIFGNGRMKGTGYVSILPVDQGIEHSAGASFAPNPAYFDPENIVKLAIEGGCNAVASTFGVLGMVAKKYAHKIPFVVKINHNQLLNYPSTFDQVMFGSVQRAYDLGAAAVGATIYFGSPESNRQIVEVAQAFEAAHELGMATILWCYLRNSSFKKDLDYHTAADLTGQANHLGVTIQADIIKQKLPENNGGYTAINFGKTSPLVYDQLTTDHPIDLCRYQVANCYMGRCGLINSGGASSGAGDLAQAVKTAVINKRAGGMGLISGRKAFQRPMKEGVGLLNAIQDVYLDPEIAIA
jgi:class I fructose-bisphosphate aldolase